MTNRGNKSSATQGEHAKTFTRKALKIHKMPPTEYSIMLRKYKF